MTSAEASKRVPVTRKYFHHKYNLLRCGAVQSDLSSLSFGGQYCLLFQSRRVSQASNQHEGSLHISEVLLCHLCEEFAFKKKFHSHVVSSLLM
jgi:hypothetical protein